MAPSIGSDTARSVCHPSWLPSSNRAQEFVEINRFPESNPSLFLRESPLGAGEGTSPMVPIPLAPRPNLPMRRRARGEKHPNAPVGKPGNLTLGPVLYPRFPFEKHSHTIAQNLEGSLDFRFRGAPVPRRSIEIPPQGDKYWQCIRS